jgi:hypothetical protein
VVRGLKFIPEPGPLSFISFPARISLFFSR